MFFCGNQVSNKLYLNKGGMKFEDITEQAGLMSQNVWSAGVSMVDINGDGLLDIYVCKSGPPGGNKRHNELFINNGDLTFSEQSVQFGLDNEGLSSHAAFFDYDLDGDLDCYLLNNSIKSVGGYDIIKNQRNRPDSLGGNKLLRNDEGYFNDVTQEVGIYASDIGFGLGVTIGDINQDQWPDIYVSNDFFERDYLYINDQQGGFNEVIEAYIQEMSKGSMGADFADINNDGQSEIFVTEMLPEHHQRQVSKALFESWDKHQLLVKNGYAHQFGRNVLQLNNGNNTFSEISRYAGVEATDWSWGALIFDMDNDGYKDIFVANGIYKDLLDLDYVNFMSQPGQIKNIIKMENDAIKSMIDLMPSEPLANYAFHNKGENTFENKAEVWGLTDLTFSSGAAYGDLDNDGDLDLVVNNVNMPSWIYQNNTQELDSLQN
ncbi:MAG: FG-GAP repeat domain-containing protein, partial [Gammaproteobacteria bacterium]